MRSLATLLILLLSACAAPVTPVPADATWRIASYNIRHGRGSDDRVDLERTAAVLRRLDADVIALQEVDERVTRSGVEDQAARLGELLGMHHAFGSFMEYQGGRYGLAILSRCPIAAAEPVRLTDGNEPRVALVVTVAPPGGTAIRVIDVHFDWVADDAFRFAQATQVALLLDTMRTPYVLAGDFNDQPGSRTLRLFRERAVEAVKADDDRLTFSATEPRREIDFVFVGPDRSWRNASARVITEPIASDHRPVVAEATLAGGSGSPAACRRGAGASVEGDNGEES
jgi:endonuclease/exonuclease/phosphatase family metal-dependent hydrolase